MSTAETERLQVESWRAEQAVQLGYSKEDAFWIMHSTIDLHDLRKLLDAGCPRKLALDILA